MFPDRDKQSGSASLVTYIPRHARFHMSESKQYVIDKRIGKAILPIERPRYLEDIYSSRGNYANYCRYPFRVDIVDWDTTKPMKGIKRVSK